MAIAGLALGIINSYLQWASYRRDRADVHVDVIWATPTYDLPGGGMDVGETMIAVTATNRGRQPAGITGMGLVLSDGRTIPLMHNEPGHVLPAVLQPGDHRTMWIASGSVDAEVRRRGLRIKSVYAHGPAGQRWEQTSLGQIGKLGR